MDCCSGSGVCPMHGSTAPGAVTQAQADSCCAASDSDTSVPSAAIFSISLSTALLTSPQSALMPAVVSPPPVGAWRVHAPRVLGPVSTHVLLSVFLI